MFALLLLSAIRLSTDVICPNDVAVRASLESLGVGPAEREGTASWSITVNSLELTVLTASTASVASARIERSLPLGPCKEMADQIAVVVERATSPLGSYAEVEEPKRTMPLVIHGGALALISGEQMYGFTVRADLWPGDAAFGFLAGFEATLEKSFEARVRDDAVTGLKLARYGVGLGLAMRKRFQPLDIGVSLLAVLEHLRGEPSGVSEAEPVREFRLAFHGGPFARLELGTIVLGVEAHARTQAKRSYRAVPATPLVDLGSFEFQGVVTAGAIFF